MNVNLLSLAEQALGSDFSKLAGQFLGEPESATQSAMRNLLPAVVGMIAQKGATAQGAASMLSQIDRANLDTRALEDIGGLLRGGGSTLQSLMRLGTDTLVPALFGDKAGNLVSSLATASGLKSPSVTNLLAMVVPLILGFVKRYVAEKRLDAGALAAMLGQQGPNLSSAIDNRVASALGFASPAAFVASIGSAVADAARRAGSAAASGAGAAASAAAGTAAAATAATKSGFMRWLPWIIAAAILLFLWNLFTGKPTPPPAPAPAPKAAAPAAPAAPVAGAPAPATAAGFPAKVYFDTGSAAIGPVSNATVTAIAEAIKKDSLKVALTGYTDKTGDVAKNEELAKNRAIAVRDALKAAGVPEGSIAMQPPIFVEAGVAANDPEARRVEITKQ